MDAEGHIVQETYGNSVAYNTQGNLTSKSGVGAYSYADPAGKIHAICQAGANAYRYDANGNLIAGGGRSAVWTTWNMPASLTENGQTTTWLYGPEHDRYKMVTLGRTTWYLNPSVHQGGHYERTQYASGTVEHRHTLYGGGRPIGEVLTFENPDESPSPAQTRYFHSDGQGSISVVTDSAGAVLTRYKYDPWGKQTLVSGSNTGISQTRQGHTGHEMLDGGLTHMNGRLYDPVLARFVSADPIVQAPYDLQSLNRYSYVLNNPLYYTDPTGFSAWTKFRDKILKPVVAIAAAWVIGPAVFNAVLPSAVGAAGATGMGMTGSMWAGSAIAGAASGAVVGGIAGGIYNGPQGIAQGAKYGAIGGAITGPVTAMYGGINGHGGSPWDLERVGAQSLAGGVSSVAQGGSFADGFRPSFVLSSLSYASDYYRRAVGYAANPLPGENRADQTTYIPDPDGRQKIYDRTLNVVGNNDLTSFCRQGSVCSKILNEVPLIAPTAGLHDYWFNMPGHLEQTFINNVGTMLPAAAISTGALLGNLTQGRESSLMLIDRIRR